MAMLAATEPGSEIALGLQLKHVATRALANRSTQGYTATDTAWESHLDSALAGTRFTHLRDLYDRRVISLVVVERRYSRSNLGRHAGSKRPR